ncbi:hypothetical protein THAOC_35360 [Thalassiosira oceanica]|uniref:Uncharacterized protein n=1 Tax=Thalassiosira oceanica TaxID=159749 RepID=K0R115_THAOC|nr:hypothetical protein THAOC_35360 [Thalassiosira oceanica]|eukprot:EJK45998.1 hypothetical protein THAOC_35360 [Thalassiosira oceanica]
MRPQLTTSTQASGPPKNPYKSYQKKSNGQPGSTLLTTMNHQLTNYKPIPASQNSSVTITPSQPTLTSNSVVNDSTTVKECITSVTKRIQGGVKAKINKLNQNERKEKKQATSSAMAKSASQKTSVNKLESLTVDLTEKLEKMNDFASKKKEENENSRAKPKKASKAIGVKPSSVKRLSSEKEAAHYLW